ncbi:MAG: Tex-like N-terminal domain-containing protein, partial [Halanaerobiales bacterium]
MEKLILIIAEELKIKPIQVEGTVKLLDEGNTVPFIARYRKEVTGNLDELQIRQLEERLNYLRNLEKRKEEVIRLIAEQDKLTEELEEQIREATILQEVEDLYRPYRQKRRTRATKAKEKGLEPLAQLIWEQDTFSGSLEEYGKSYLDPEKELNNLDEVYQGARDIIAEWISDDAEIRKAIREYSYEKGVLESTVKKQELDEEGKYELYYEYKEAARKLPPHRVLAINRGEKEEILSVKLVLEEEKVYGIIKKRVQKNTDNIFTDQLILALEDAYKRLIAPSIEREIRNSLTEKAEEHAIEVFSRNLKSLLLQAPFRDHVVMGIDPGFRTGSKVAVVDETGKLLATASIFPHPPQNEKEKAARLVLDLIEKYQVE